MSSLNKACLLGNVGKDPEIRYSQSGEPIASFSLATTEKWAGKDGNKQEKTQWHNISVFGKTAEIVRDYVTKGKQLYVEGAIEHDTWTDKDGNKRNATKIKVSGFNGKLVLLGGGGKRDDDAEENPREVWGQQAPAAEISNEDVPFALLLPVLFPLLGLAAWIA